MLKTLKLLILAALNWLVWKARVFARVNITSYMINAEETRKIKVLHFTDIVNRFDFIDNVIRYVDKDKFEVGLCLTNPNSNIQAASYPNDFPFWVIESKGRRSFPRVARELARVLRTWGADIIHTHHYDPAVIGFLATRLYPQTKLVVGRHYSDAIYRIPSKIKRDVYLMVENAVNSAATRIIVPSKYIREILVDWQGVAAEKVDVIYYGFDPEKYSLPREDEIKILRAEMDLEGKFVIGTFARLHEEKGHRFLLEAVSQLSVELPRLVWLIVGDGPERRDLERRVAEKGLEGRVVFLGWRRDAIKLMAAIDVVVQPTLHEAFSQVMIEALWMKRPLIITEVSGAVDIIRDGENGILVPKENPTALASAISRLACNRALREKMVNNGYTFVNEHLIITKIIRHYEQSYFKAIN